MKKLKFSAKKTILPVMMAIFLLAACVPGFEQGKAEGEILAPVMLGASDRYLDYLENPEAYGEYIPPYNFDIEQAPDNSLPPLEADPLPSSYSSVNQGYATPVKNQGSDGTCVVYSTTAAMETYLKKNTGVTYDLSENHIKYSLSDSAYYDGTNYFGYSRSPGGGASFGQIATYLFNGLGPVQEVQSPYVWGDNQVSINSIEPIVPGYRFTKVYHLNPSGDLNSWIADVKNMIVEYGSVAIAIDYQGDYFDRTGKYMYDYRTSRGVNHAVLLVGWDDNMAASNFANGSNGATPSSNGGFIVRNSWGDGYADGGYFYISYQNCTLSQTDALVLADYTVSDADQTLNTYTEYGRTTVVGYGVDSPTWFANKFYLGANEYVTLDEVGFYAVASNLRYEVYLSSSGSTNTSDMTMIASGTTDKYGYYSVPVNSSVTLGSSSESSYTVAVKVFSNSSMYPIPVEFSTGETTNLVTGYISYTSNGDRIIAPNVSSVTDSLNSSGISYSVVPTGFIGYGDTPGLGQVDDYNIVVTSVTSPANAAPTHSIPGSFIATGSMATDMQNNSSYISSTANNSYAQYNVNVASAGSYAMTINMIAGDSAANRSVYVYANDVLIGTVRVENTTSATNFMAHRQFVSFPSAGVQTLRLVADSGVNIQGLTFESSSPVTNTLPAVINALDYTNQEGILVSGDHINYLSPGDTFTYSVDVVNAGLYYISFNSATVYDQSGATLNVIKNGISYLETAFTVPNTGDWNNYADSSAIAVNLTSGLQQLKFTVARDFDVKSISITQAHRTAGEISAFDTIEAEFCDLNVGTVVENKGQNSGNLGGVLEGNYVMYQNVNLGGKGASSVTFGASVTVTGSYIEVRADSQSGTLLGTCTLTSTGNWSTWDTFTCDIDSSVTGIHDIYLIFHGSSYVCNLDWFRFNAREISAYNTIEAEWSDDYSHAIKIENYGENGGGNVGNTKNGLFTAYKNVNFGTTGAASVSFRTSSATSAEGTVEIRLGSRNGALIGSCKTQSTGSWSTWTDYTCDIIPTTGIKDVYLVYVPDSGKEYVANIEWFRFNELSAVTIDDITVNGSQITCQTSNGIGEVKYWFYVIKDGKILFNSGIFSSENFVTYNAPAGSKVRVYCSDQSGTRVVKSVTVQ